MKRPVIALIPVYKPSEKLVPYICELEHYVEKIVVISDGNTQSEFDTYISELHEHENVTVLTHCVNLGKGRALKTGINQAIKIAAECGSLGVITVDADGQHSISDVIKIADCLIENPDKIVLGVRNFSNDDIPLRSKLGNQITKLVFRWLCGMKVTDTQTGLRGIPACYLPECIEIEGERYEYETNFLLQMNAKARFIEIEIATIYENNNESSHFNPLIDSIKIYKVIFKYTLSSLLAVLIDFSVFTFVTGTGISVVAATYMSRAFAAIVNYLTNRKVVFNSSGKVLPQIIKYIFLVFFSGTLSAVLIDLISSYIAVSVVLIKIPVEGFLYLFNYYIQNMFIFGEDREN